MTADRKPPTGPTEVVWVGDTIAGRREKECCFPTGERAKHFAEDAEWPLPSGWRYRPCTHIPPGTADR